MINIAFWEINWFKIDKMTLEEVNTVFYILLKG